MRRCCRNNYNCNLNNIIPRNSINTNNPEYDECECGFSDEQDVLFTKNPMYGHAYVPIQKMGNVFKQNHGLEKGTIFPELVSPYSPNDSVIENEFLESQVIESECDNNGMQL